MNWRTPLFAVPDGIVKVCRPITGWWVVDSIDVEPAASTFAESPLLKDDVANLMRESLDDPNWQ